MVSDSEPRYRLVDADGNVVGSIYAQADGTLAIQEGTSGADNEATLATDGTWQVPLVDTDQRTVADLGSEASPTNNQTISTATNTQVNLESADSEDADAVDVDLANNKLVAQLTGKYLLSAQVTYDPSTSWSQGDRIEGWVSVGGSIESINDTGHHGQNRRASVPVAPCTVEISNPPTDIVLNARQEAGQDETIAGSPRETFATAVFLG